MNALSNTALHQAARQWLADGTTRIAADDGRLVAGGVVSGGAWLDAPTSAATPQVLHVRGQPMRRFESYFAPLIAAKLTAATSYSPNGGA